jgi:hypothetical protein
MTVAGQFRHGLEFFVAPVQAERPHEVAGEQGREVIPDEARIGRAVGQGIPQDTQVQPGGPAEQQGLGHRDRLPEPQQVDQQLDRVTGPVPAHVPDPAQDLQQIPVLREDRCFTPDQKAQGALLRGVHAPAHRRLQNLHSAAEEHAADVGHGGRRVAGHVDPRGPVAQRGRDITRAEHQLTHLARAGQDGDQDVDAGREPGQIRHPARSAPGSRAGSLGPPVSRPHAVAGPDQVRADRNPHPAQPRQPDLRHRPIVRAGGQPRPPGAGAAVLSWLYPRALSVFPSVLFPGGSPGCSAALVCRSAPPARPGAGRTPHGHGRAPGPAGERGYQP